MQSKLFHSTIMILHSIVTVLQCGDHQHILNGTCVCDDLYISIPNNSFCVYACYSVNLFTSLTGRDCVRQCGDNQLTMYSHEQYGYICLCQEHLTANLQRTLCVSSCEESEVIQFYGPSPTYFIFKFCACGGNHPIYDSSNKICTSKCPEGMKLNVPQGICVQKCNGFQEYEEMCLHSCPTGMYQNISNMSQCVSCQLAQIQIISDSSDRCGCPLGQIQTMYGGDCTFCNGTKEYFYNNSGSIQCVSCWYGSYIQGSWCVDKCSEGFHPDSSNLYCVVTCNEEQPIFQFDGTCGDSCSVGQINDSEMKECICKNGYLSSNNESCVSQCEENDYVSLDRKRCVAECSPYFVDLKGAQCTSDYFETNTFINSNNQFQCVDGTFMQIDGLCCSAEPGFAQHLQNNEFVCNDGLEPSADMKFCICKNEEQSIGENGSCVDVCDQGTIVENVTSGQRLCIPNKCTVGFINIYRNRCAKSCGPHYFVDAQGISCLRDCDFGQSISVGGIQCLMSCESGMAVTTRYTGFYDNYCRCPKVIGRNQTCQDHCDAAEIPGSIQYQCTCPPPLVYMDGVCKCPNNQYILNYIYGEGEYQYYWCVPEEQCIENNLSVSSINGVLQCICPQEEYLIDQYQCTPSCSQMLDLTGQYCIASCQGSFSNLAQSKCEQECEVNSYPTQMESVGYQCSCVYGQYVSFDNTSCEQCTMYVENKKYCKTLCGSKMYVEEQQAQETIRFCVDECNLPYGLQQYEEQQLCYKCKFFTERVNQACVDTCHYQNNSICEQPNSDFCKFINNQTCVNSCLSGYFIEEELEKTCVTGCDFPFLQKSMDNQTLCYSCQFFVSREQLECKSKCIFYNDSICESIGSEFCPFYQLDLDRNQNVCVQQCTQKQQAIDFECIDRNYTSLYIGVGVGCITFVSLICVFVIWIVKRKQKYRKISNDEHKIDNTNKSVESAVEKVEVADLLK